MPTVNAGVCTGCGRCVPVCPYDLLEPGGAGVPVLQDGWSTRCLECGHCAAVCAVGAVDIDGLPASGPAGEPLAHGEILGQLLLRRSVRQYQRRDVPRELIAQVLEAGRFAPTGHNAREIGCVAVVSSAPRARLAEEIGTAYRRFAAGVGNPLVRLAMALWIGPSRVRELRASLSGLQWAQQQIERGRDPLFHNAPVILLLHAPPAETAEADCALAAGQMSLLAPSLGLGTCHIGYASALLKRLPGIARSYGVPRGKRVFSVLTLGYPAVEWCGVPPRPVLPVTWR